MKKITNVLLLILFLVSVFFSISNNFSIADTKSKTAGYASIIPIPPPEPPARRGC